MPALGIEVEMRKGLPAARQKEFEQRVKTWLEGILIFAHTEFLAKVPWDQDSGRGGRTFDAIKKSEVRKVGPLFFANVGIGPILDLKEGEDPEYPLFVHRGTGIYGGGGNLITAPMFRKVEATSGGGGPGSLRMDRQARLERISAFDALGNFHGNIMVFEKRGELRFRPWVKGQKPNPYLQEIERNVQARIKMEKRELLGIMKQAVRTSIIN